MTARLRLVATALLVGACTTVRSETTTITGAPVVSTARAPRTIVLRGEQLERSRAMDVNDHARSENRGLATLQPVLLGITKA